MNNALLLVLLLGITFIKREVEVVKWPQLESYIAQKEDKIKIINFWATWCKPCMEELPHFEKIQQQYKDKKVEVLLVSLDQVSLKNKVKASLEKNGITAKTVLLDEVDFNKWINRVDSSWSGALPATLIVTADNTHKQFYEKQFSYEELEKLILSLNH